MRVTLALPLAILLGAAPAGAITPHLVKDINMVPRSAGSAPADYVTVGGLAYFTADDSLTGRELWRTDGTEAGTFQIVDACPGECSGSPRFVAQNGRSYFFLASPEKGNEELWVTGGAPASTFRLTDGLRFPAVYEGIWSAWVASQGVLYFAADDDGVHGRELWRTDGTRAGTFMVADLRLGFAGSNPGDLTDFNGRLFFRADDGLALWTSDGTAAGTRLVRDPDPSTAGNSGPVYLRVVGRTLFFVAPVKNRGFELWKSDGTARGTTPLTNVRFSPTTPFFDFAVLGNRLLFVASDPAHGQELWASDGTAAGTRALTNLPRADAFFNLNEGRGFRLPQVSLGNRLVFRVDDGPHGAELWTTDGTPKGTRIIVDLCPGPCGGAGSEPVIIGSRAFFTGGFEPWSTDGTAAGTRKIRQICTQDPCFNAPIQWRAGKGKAFFVRVDDISLVVQLWSTDGTEQGTVRLAPQADVSRYNLDSTLLGGKLLFTANDGSLGAEPWISDGTPQGTRPLRDIDLSNAGGSWPSDLRTAGGKVYFTADDGEHGFSLWVSDGTDAGTRFVADVFPEQQIFNPPHLLAAAAAGGLDYLVVGEAAAGEVSYALWRSDGTPGGTVKLLPAGQLSRSVGLAVLGNQVFFAASDGIHGDELWQSDGTAGGTRMVVDLLAGPVGSAPRGLAVFHGKLYFAAQSDAGLGLWQSDGTAAGTTLVKQAEVRFLSESRFLTEHAGRLLFSGWNAEEGLQLWSTDGTAAGTVALDLVPGAGRLAPFQMISDGSRLFFWSDTFEPNGAPHNDAGMWVSDGTAAGTRRIANAYPNDPREVAKPIVFNGNVYFGSADNLWKSDGTAAGTGPLLTRQGYQIHDPLNFRIFAGRLFFAPYYQNWLMETDGTQAGTFKLLDLVRRYNVEVFEFEPLGGRLLFRGWDRDHGVELWALEE